MGAKSFKRKMFMQVAVLATPLWLAGCSSIPDAANPVEWYRSTVDYFSDDEAAETVVVADPAAEGSAPAPQVTTKSGELPPGFVAAKTPTRQYAQPIARQGDVVNALGDATTTVASNQPPAPVAAPTTPVETAQMAPVDLKDPSAPMSAPAPVTQGSLMPASPQVQPVAELDKRSVGQIYAENLAQTRPNLLPGTSSEDIVMRSFETVVVSGAGVSRQAPTFAPRPQQFASLGNVTQSDAQSASYSSAFGTEPAVVRQGRAHSMSRYNPAMYSGSYQVATIQFGNGSANLTAEDKRILREVLNIHREQGGVIRVVGHASSRTKDMTADQHMKVNHSVSLSRADKVAFELLAQGMPGERLFVGGVSDSQPLYQEVMPSGEAGNRRTEIFVDY